MAFTILHQEDARIPTANPHEVVQVQVMQVALRDGSVSNRVEGRIWLEQSADKYSGPTKTALVFDSLDQVKEFTNALLNAAKFLDSLVPGVAAQVPQKPAAKPVVRKRQPAKAAPRKRVA